MVDTELLNQAITLLQKIQTNANRKDCSFSHMTEAEIEHICGTVVTTLNGIVVPTAKDEDTKESESGENAKESVSNKDAKESVHVEEEYEFYLAIKPTREQITFGGIITEIDWPNIAGARLSMPSLKSPHDIWFSGPNRDFYKKCHFIKCVTSDANLIDAFLNMTKLHGFRVEGTRN